ncbi:MAG TPA: AI-2E family transporter [Micromonosporaceae bacterium]|nr:AI-2E family transporter [Micromonosporaceae bacterium]
MAEAKKPVCAGAAGDSVHRAWDRIPPMIRSAVVWSGALLIIAAGLYLVGSVAVWLTPLTVALAATLFLAALLDPLLVRLRRLRFPASLAALATLLLLLGFIVGSVMLVWNVTDDQFANLSQQLDEGLARLRSVLLSALPISAEQLDEWVKRAGTGLRQPPQDPVASARAALEAAGVVLLSVVLLFFLLKDGRMMWRWLLGRVSERSRPTVAAAGRAGWQTLAAYSRGTLAVAAIDAVGIGLALVVLGVPVPLPLALITFLGGFVPLIGATIAGSVAVLVALAAKGPTTALLTAAAVIIVQQVEGNLLEPLIMKRQVRLHPIVVLVAVTAGTLAGGIGGAFVAVPITAVGYRVVETVTACRHPDHHPDTAER